MCRLLKSTQTTDKETSTWKPRLKALRCHTTEDLSQMKSGNVRDQYYKAFLQYRRLCDLRYLMVSCQTNCKVKTQILITNDPSVAMKKVDSIVPRSPWGPSPPLKMLPTSRRVLTDTCITHRFNGIRCFFLSHTDSVSWKPISQYIPVKFLFCCNSSSRLTDFSWTLFLLYSLFGQCLYSPKSHYYHILTLTGRVIVVISKYLSFLSSILSTRRTSRIKIFMV